MPSLTKAGDFNFLLPSTPQISKKKKAQKLTLNEFAAASPPHTSLTLQGLDERRNVEKKRLVYLLHQLTVYQKNAFLLSLQVHRLDQQDMQHLQWRRRPTRQYHNLRSLQWSRSTGL